MSHGKTAMARKILEEWKKEHPDGKVQVFDPKTMEHTPRPRFRSEFILHPCLFYQFKGGQV